jgi:hypothetical protein
MGLTFFAAHDDLVPVMLDVERLVPIQYTRCDNTERNDYPTYSSIAQIDGVGIATGTQSALCTAHLITPRGTEVVVRTVHTIHGVRYAVDQLMNNVSTRLLQGGAVEELAVYEGNLGTAYTSGFTRKLHAAMRRSMLRRFAKNGIVFIGPKAEAMHRAGARLTIGLDSPPQCDLVMDRKLER